MGSPYRVTSRSDLGAPLRLAVQEALDGDGSLEVVLAPGVYQNTSLTIQDRAKPPRLQVHLSAEPGAVLQGPVTVHADQISVEGLVIYDLSRGAPLVDLMVGSQAELRQVAILDGRRSDPAQVHPVVMIRSAGGQPTVRLEGGALVGNSVEGEGALLGFRGSFSSVELHEVVLADNQVSVVLEAPGAASVVITDCEINEPMAGALLSVADTARVEVSGEVGIAQAGRSEVKVVPPSGDGPGPAARARHLP